MRLPCATHLPLYRQSVICGREGVELERSLLVNWVGAASMLLRPLIDAVQRHVSAGLDSILVARDRNKITHHFVTGRGPVNVRQLAAHLLPALAPDIMLISDAAKAYQVFAKEAGVTHVSSGCKLIHPSD